LEAPKVAFQKDQKVYFKKLPRLIYGKVVDVIDEGAGQDQSVVVQPDKIRCRASDLESAELSEPPTDKAMRVLSGPMGELPKQWALKPGEQRTAI